MYGVLNLNMYVIRPRVQCQNEMKKSGQGSTYSDNLDISRCRCFAKTF